MPTLTVIKLSLLWLRQMSRLIIYQACKKNKIKFDLRTLLTLDMFFLFLLREVKSASEGAEETDGRGRGGDWPTWAQQEEAAERLRWAAGGQWAAPESAQSSAKRVEVKAQTNICHHQHKEQCFKSGKYKMQAFSVLRLSVGSNLLQSITRYRQLRLRRLSWGSFWAPSCMLTCLWARVECLKYSFRLHTLYINIRPFTIIVSEMN